MNTMELVHFASTGLRPQPSHSRSAAPPFYEELVSPARVAMIRARQRVLSAQREDGSWLGKKIYDASLASQIVFWLTFRGEDNPLLMEWATAEILQQQMPTGGWPLLPGGSADVSTSVQAYLALKLTGLSPGDGRLARARDVIRRLGGADAADSETRYFLALLGQIDYDFCAPIPPERLLFDRATSGRISALAIVWSHRAVHNVGIERGIRELFINHPPDWPSVVDNVSRPSNCNSTRWAGMAKHVRSVLMTLVVWCERNGWTPLRRRALQIAEMHTLHRAGRVPDGRQSWRELIWHSIALHAVGHTNDCSELRSCDEQLRSFAQTDDASDCVGPLQQGTEWRDSHLALQALFASGLTSADSCAVRAGTWLRRQAHLRSSIRAPQLADALQTLTTSIATSPEHPRAPLPNIQIDCRYDWNRLDRPRHTLSHRNRLAALVAHQLSHMQNGDGGWSAASDTPSSPDTTGEVLLALSTWPSCHVPNVKLRILAGIRFLTSTQRADGSWDSASGVQFVHGTALALCGLLAAGLSTSDPAVAAGINWVVAHQHENGGWGEMAATDFRPPDYVPGAATATQTAWAVRALVAAGRAHSADVRRGIDFLLQTQDDDGGWTESTFVLRDGETGRCFYSELHTIADPLRSLAYWASAAPSESANGPIHIPLRVFDDAWRD